MATDNTNHHISLAQYIELQTAVKRRKKTKEEEHRIQCECVKWFRLQYPKLKYRLFAVPNGGRRDYTTASKLKAEGVLAGVSDLILLKPNKQYGALLIEMKTSIGRLRDNQIKWKEDLCKKGEYKYVVCRSTEDFIREIKEYIIQD